MTPRLIAIGLALLTALWPGATRAQENAPSVIRLNLSPVAPAKPALQHRLHLDIADRSPGDAATLYMSAIIGWQLSPEESSNIDELLKLPMAELNAGISRQGYAHARFELLHIAARREQCNWEMPYREQGFSTLLPHLGPMRDAARTLAVHTRFQIHQRKHDEAIRLIQTGLGMSSHLNQDAVLVQQLVGAAISRLMLERLDEFVGSPGAPNLYWPLAQLPRPFHDIRETLGWERKITSHIFSTQTDDELENLTAAEFRKSEGMIRSVMGASRGPNDEAGTVLMALKAYPEAKKFLADRGMPADKVNALEPHQAIAMAMVRSHREVIDEMLKLHGLPYWQAQEEMKKIEKNFENTRMQQLWNPMLHLLPALSMANQRLVQVDRKIASLRLVEALRAHAATNGGKFPASLDDLKDTPAPVDPMTGEPFKYELRGDMAIIDCVHQDRGRPAQGWRYELTIAR